MNTLVARFGAARGVGAAVSCTSWFFTLLAIDCTSPTSGIPGA
jgi:hypothetical protein